MPYRVGKPFRAKRSSPPAEKRGGYVSAAQVEVKAEDPEKSAFFAARQGFRVPTTLLVWKAAPLHAAPAWHRRLCDRAAPPAGPLRRCCPSAARQSDRNGAASTADARWRARCARP